MSYKLGLFNIGIKIKTILFLKELEKLVREINNIILHN